MSQESSESSASDPATDINKKEEKETKMVFTAPHTKKQISTADTIKENQTFKVHVRKVLKDSDRSNVNVFLEVENLVGRICVDGMSQILKYNNDEDPIQEAADLPSGENQVREYCHDPHISRGYSLHFMMRIRTQKRFGEFKKDLLPWLRKTKYTSIKRN